MYAGRDMSDLTMISKKEWNDDELSFFHFSLSQVAPYLNQEGTTILREINEEIEKRGGLTNKETKFSDRDLIRSRTIAPL